MSLVSVFILVDLRVLRVYDRPYFNLHLDIPPSPSFRLFIFLHFYFLVLPLFTVHFYMFYYTFVYFCTNVD